MRRLFNKKERASLYGAARGRCELCGADLDGAGAWHADHKRPFSRGGPTDVLNGLALCVACNLKKGNSMIDWNLRIWQQRALDEYIAANKTDFLCVATPGAGKTWWALKVADHLLSSGVAERVVVVTPSESLKEQWADKASEAGMSLDPRWASDQFRSEAKDMTGIVATYQQVATNPHAFRAHLRRRTVVILDEIHHAGDGAGWGDALHTAFDPATRRLALSGTPWRNRNQTIPWVTYENGSSRSDFSYGYADGLADGVCRPVLFPSYEGRMEWQRNGVSQSATFADDLADDDSSRRLRTALDAGGAWLADLISRADRQLTEIRSNGHRIAGGLVLAMDQMHARAIARLMRNITGTEPPVVVSEDPDAKDKIDRFRNGDAPWIVAVRMISEGVDIKRLRVLVYATNVLSELFFRQALGRIVRTIDGIDEQSAFCYIPADDVLVKYAEGVKEERAHGIDLEQQRAAREAERTGQFSLTGLDTFTPLASSAAEHVDTIYDGGRITPEEEARARARLADLNLQQQVSVANAVLLMRSALNEQQPARAPAPEPTTPLHRVKAAKRRALSVMVRRYAICAGVQHKDAWNELARATDGKRVDDLTVEQIDARSVVVARWMERFR